VLTLTPKSQVKHSYIKGFVIHSLQHGAQTAMHKATDNAIELRNQFEIDLYNKSAPWLLLPTKSQRLLGAEVFQNG
jgi:hypothetical protein